MMLLSFALMRDSPFGGESLHNKNKHRRMPCTVIPVRKLILSQHKSGITYTNQAMPLFNTF